MNSLPLTHHHPIIQFWQNQCSNCFHSKFSPWKVRSYFAKTLPLRQLSFNNPIISYWLIRSFFPEDKSHSCPPRLLFYWHNVPFYPIYDEWHHSWHKSCTSEKIRLLLCKSIVNMIWTGSNCYATKRRYPFRCKGSVALPAIQKGAALDLLFCQLLFSTVTGGRQRKCPSSSLVFQLSVSAYF